MQPAIRSDSICKPFCDWNLPDSEDVAFKVIRSARVFGWYAVIKGRHTIAVSQRTIGYTNTLCVTMAHEMIHLHQRLAGMENPAQHNKAFYKIAAEVCAIHGFDPNAF